MKIMLIKPPIKGFMHEIGRHIPIGLAYLSAVLRQAGHETIIFDALAYTEDNCLVPPDKMSDVDLLKLNSHPRWQHLIRWGASLHRIESALQEFQPDVVGVSCMFSPYYETAYDVARLAKRLFPEVKVLLGGPHATVAYEHALKVPEIDLVILGEAETSIVSLLDDLAAGRKLVRREGLAFRCNEGYCECAPESCDKIHLSPKANWLQALDTLPFPAADQLQFERYGSATTLITSRGCPFSCTFCTVHATVGKKFRSRTPANVADEIEYYLDNFGIRKFSIEDDNFTFDIHRVYDICGEIKARDLDVELNLPNGMTVVKLDEKLVQVMVDAGFRKLFLGLESTDAARLSAIAKRFTSLDQVEKGAAWFKHQGADVSASLIVGLPGQPLTEIIRDVTNLLCRGIQFWSNPFYPIPGSPDYRRCIALDIIEEQTEYSLFDQYNFSSGSDILSPHELYWAWVATQTVAQWPYFIREGRALSRQRTVSVAEAISSLINYHKAAGKNISLEVPAVPVKYWEGSEGLYVAVDAEFCFCTAHHLKPSHTEKTVADVCLLTGDVIASALAMYTGTPLECVEAECRLNHTIPRCVFLLREGRLGWNIQREFIAGLDAALEELNRTKVS